MVIPHPTIAAILFLLSMASTNNALADRLQPCPASPNCVSSLAEEGRHAIAPLSFPGDADRAWETLRTVVGEQPRTRIVHADEIYLHAECRSLVFRFVDDLEFMRQPGEDLIHVRSASRSGYSDLGVNRRRVERVRRALAEALSNR